MTDHIPDATKKVLSPATRAVFEAFNSKFEWIEDGVPGPQFHAIGAALRALADQLRLELPLGDTDADAGVFATHQAIYRYLRDIATELEGQ